MQPWYIATETFSPRQGEAWKRYVEWSGLTQLSEVVSLDSMLCPTLLRDIRDDYWPHVVSEEFMNRFFIDLEFLLAQVSGFAERNLLCVYRNPPSPPSPCGGPIDFEFLGYDVVDEEGIASALTNCGGFAGVFDNTELSPLGLLTSHARAFEVQSKLRANYPDEDHAHCHVWAIFREVRHRPH